MNKKSKNENYSFLRVRFEKEEKRLRELKLKLEPWVQEQGRRNGVWNIPLYDAPPPCTDHVEKQVYAELQQAIAKMEATLHQAYNCEKETEKKTQGRLWKKNKEGDINNTVERAASIEALKNEMLLLKKEIQELEQEATLSKGEIEGLVAKIQSRPRKRPRRTVLFYYSAAGVISLAELPVNFTAIVEVSDIMPLFMCYISAGFMSLIGAFIAHYFGKGLARKIARDEREQYQSNTEKDLQNFRTYLTKEKLEIGLPLLGFGLLALVVFMLRWEQGDWFFSFFNVALILIASTCSYFHTDTTPLKEEYDSQVRGYNQIKKQKKRMEKNLIKYQNKIARLELITQDEATNRQGHRSTDDRENIVVTLREYQLEYESLHWYLVERYRHANTSARIDNSVPLVVAWEHPETDSHLQLEFTPLTTNH